jgi:hypothetical protein
MQNFSCPLSKVESTNLCSNIGNRAVIDGCNRLDIAEECCNVGKDNRDLSLMNVVSDIRHVDPDIASFSDSNLCYDPLVEVPVAKVTQMYDKWKHYLLSGDDDLYVLNGIQNGFSIVDLNCALPKFSTRNYKSTANENKLKVETRILEEIHAGNYIKTPIKPSYVSALGAVPKDVDDVCVIHDLSRPAGGINSLASDTSVKYTTIEKVTKLISADSYIAKVDLRSAYRSIPIAKHVMV